MIFLAACVPEVKQSTNTVDLDVKNDSFKKITSLAAAQKIDSLLIFLRAESPNDRHLAARAFASIMSKNAADSLSLLLTDDVVDVKAMVAYAMGQQYEPNLQRELVNAFRTKDTIDVNNIFNSRILEAVGKTGSKRMLKAISTIKTYRSDDDLLLLGQARGIYRFAMRDIISEEGTEKMLDFLTTKENSDEIKILAANYFSRAKDLDYSNIKFRLIEEFTTADNPYIKMFLAQALGKTKDPEIASYLENQLKLETNSIVKYHIIGSFKHFPYIRMIDRTVELLNNEDPLVSKAASQFLLENGKPEDAFLYRNFITDSLNINSKSTIYKAILKHLPYYYTNSISKIRKVVLDSIQNQENIFIKSNFIEALSMDPTAYKSLIELYDEENEALINTKVVEGLGNILSSEKFTYTFKNRSNRVRTEIIDTFKTLLKTRDIGMTAEIGNALSNPSAALENIIKDTNFLEESRAALPLPMSIEAYNALGKAISYLNGKEFIPKEMISNHTMDWSLLQNMSDTTEIIIKTDNGNISLELYPDLAPVTVSNFLRLVNDNYYDGQLFHRVVPGFVVQTGDERSDSYGSLSYTIPSELGPAYYNDAGYIGMASAGTNTESSQWFITQAPTPHLDGRYTLFGKVKEGQKIVNNINRGDRIVDIIISY